MGRLLATQPAQRGIILPIIVLVMVFITVSALAIADFAINHFSRVSRRVAETNALLTAEAGVEETIAQLNEDENFAGYTTPQEFFNDDAQGRATFETAVTDTGDDQKEIISTAKVYLPEDNSEPAETHRIKVIAAGVITGAYAVQSGVGGLEMSNSATVANGEVYINGELHMQNTAQIGTESDPTKVWVAHQTCPDPPDATYPTQCTSGEPITMQNQAHIYGEVRATNQTDGSGMSDPGLLAGENAAPVSLPDHDRDAQQAAVTSTRDDDDASCSGNQTDTWAANLHITGDQVTLKNQCQITVEGDIWIDGSLELNNTAKLIVSDSLGDTQPVIMVDGQNGFKIQNNTELVPNSSDAGFKIITYWSQAACSPDCGDVTGPDLANSQGQMTIDINNSALASKSILYARWSKVRLQNGGTIGALVGQTVELQNSGNVLFNGEEVFGERTWAVKTYQRLSDE